MARNPLHLFEAYGIELEYMVVDRETLAVRPIVDELLREAMALPGARIDEEDEEDPSWPGTVEFDDVSWSNELVLHVLEFKTTMPVGSLEGVDEVFASHVRRANEMLASHGAMLMPTGMHPTMDPYREMRLWPHGYSDVYEAFNAIFDCRGHGWANLQSAHLNLPFGSWENEGDEFGRLHAAVRAVLPIMAALSASTPIMDGRVTGMLDTRLEVYRTNSRRIPQAAGLVIPEAVYTKGEYERRIFERIYAAMAPLDPKGVLRNEFANARGAIARFVRNSIEVRVLDVQECPRADAAVIAMVCGAVRMLCDVSGEESRRLRALPVHSMHTILLDVIRAGERAVVDDEEYLGVWGYPGTRCTAQELWQYLRERMAKGVDLTPHAESVDILVSKGPLSRRIARSLGLSLDRGMASPVVRARVDEVYRDLARCLAQNEMFQPD